MEESVRAAVLAVGTLLSEDLTSIAAGAMVAEGLIGFPAAAAGCVAGILAGDILLFLVGRRFGRRALTLPIVRRLISEEAVERASRTLRRHGPLIALTARLVPGTRVPTYVAAGALRVDGWTFTAYLALAAITWTPIVIALSAAAGARTTEAGLLRTGSTVTRVLVFGAVALGTVRLGRTLLTWRGRRRLAALWRRVTRWEFWPPYLFYAPLLAQMVWLTARYRSCTLFTAANPGIPNGGFIGESKFAILGALGSAGDRVARAALIPAHLPPADRMAAADAFMTTHKLDFPIVLKPDQGQRGSGVTIVSTPDTLAAQLTHACIDLILQEYAPGREFGVFYSRHPGTHRGRIWSMAEKRFPSVTGDGRRTLEELILADPRAAVYERLHRRAHASSLQQVPARGELVRLGEIGSHCRGAMFIDATPLVTPALEAAFDAVARAYAGFYFGRFDVRVKSMAEFLAGCDFKIVELNGVTSEAAHIYDPHFGLWTAYRVVAKQWELAFDIGAENQRRGAPVTPVAELVASVQAYRRFARLHPEGMTPYGPQERQA